MGITQNKQAEMIFNILGIPGGNWDLYKETPYLLGDIFEKILRQVSILRNTALELREDGPAGSLGDNCEPVYDWALTRLSLVRKLKELGIDWRTQPEAFFLVGDFLGELRLNIGVNEDFGKIIDFLYDKHNAIFEVEVGRLDRSQVTNVTWNASVKKIAAKNMIAEVTQLCHLLKSVDMWVDTIDLVKKKE